MAKRKQYLFQKFTDIICFLTLQKLQFCRHYESKDSENRGSYWKLLNLLAESGPQLQIHLQNCSVFSGENSIIQNYLIEACNEHLIKIY